MAIKPNWNPIHKPGAIREYVLKTTNPEKAPVPVVNDIYTITNPEWLKLRSGYATGTTSGILMNVNEYTCTYEEYRKRLGIEDKLPKKIVPAAQERLDSGHVWEPTVAQIIYERLCKQEWVHSVEVYDDSTMYQCGIKNPDGTLKYPFAAANPDFFFVINGVGYYVECKTTGYMNTGVIEDWNKGIVPRSYYAQVQHSFLCYGLEKGIIGCQWGMHKFSDSAAVVVDYDEKFIAELVEKEAEFMECVELGIEPAEELQDPGLLGESIARRYGMEDTLLPAVELGEGFAPEVKEFLDLDKEEKELKKRLREIGDAKDKLGNKFVTAMVSPSGASIAGYAYCNLDGKHFAIKVQNSRPAIDVDRFQREHPDVYEEVVCHSVTKSALQDYDIEHGTKYAGAYSIRVPKEIPSFTVSIKEDKKSGVKAK